MGELSEKWTPTSTGKWFLDSKKRLGAKMLIVETGGKIVGINGIISERNSGKGRFFTGIVVSPGYRRRGIGSLLLHKTLADLKREGLRWAEVETIQGIPAAKYLYPKYGGTGIQVPAWQLVSGFHLTECVSVDSRDIIFPDSED